MTTPEMTPLQLLQSKHLTDTLTRNFLGFVTSAASPGSASELTADTVARFVEAFRDEIEACECKP